ncbi:MAG: right-handed parallel beta-helix repeat-containing protein [Desulfobacteraceae bacterium]|nr:right-handed parallel beta-helix repeat-containing protein [Desulfobacteraceae bacterium]
MVVKPVAMVDNTSSLATASPIAAIMLVKDTKGPVALTNLIVDGADSPVACGRNPVGIFYRNASGSVSDSTVRNIRMASGSEGCGGGIGIFAQSGLALTSNVTVKGCNVHDFQKTGIAGNEVGTKLTATANVVLGDGPISYVAQNGIQIGYGATGSLTDNRVSEFAWTPCVDTNNCAWCSTGILLYDPDSLATSSVNANGNIVSHTQCAGIYQWGNSGQIVSNYVSATDPWDGIAVMGNNNMVKSNTVTKSNESGIWLQGDKNSITLNRIQETPIGIWIDSGTGNNYPTNSNTFPNVGEAIRTGVTDSALMMMQAGSNADRNVTPDRF